MISFFFVCNTIILLIVWWIVFNSRLWEKNFTYQLVIFIAPLLYGLLILVILFNIFPLALIRSHKHYIYFFSSLNLLLLLPQWYKLAWLQLQKVQKRNLTENSKLIFAVFLVILMIFAMVVFFALVYILINSISGETQGLLSALQGYFPIEIDFTTALYFSFVTYFTLGYGDLIPFGTWMRFFVFLECLSSVLNTGLIAVYVYNFLFYNEKKKG